MDVIELSSDDSSSKSNVKLENSFPDSEITENKSMLDLFKKYNIEVDNFKHKSHERKISVQDSQDEINNFHTISSSSDTEEDKHLPLQSPRNKYINEINEPKQKKRKSLQRNIDKQMHLEKKLEREQKKTENEKAKEEKRALVAAQKNMKPEELIKQITVLVNSNIISSPCGVDIPSTLQSAGITYRISEQNPANIISWTCQTQMQLSKADGQLGLTNSSQNCQEVIYIMMFNELVPLVHNESLTIKINSLKVSTKIFLGIYGMENYFKSKKNSKNNDKTNKVLPTITRKDLDMALIELQIMYDISHRMLETPQDLGALVLQFTKSIAQAPYKLQKHLKQQEMDWYISGDNKDCVRVDKNGNGLPRLWQQHLTQFTLARLETAEAICSQYPSPSSLLQAYDRSTKEEGEKLLQDINIRRAAGPLTSVRKIGPELSKKIYALYTALDGETYL